MCKGFAVAIAAAVAFTGVLTYSQKVYASAVMTPYDESISPDVFLNGATFILKRTDDTKGWLTRELALMQSRYNINTVNLYALEDFDEPGRTEYKDWLFAELERLGMKAVIRIEAYDPPSFAFTSANLERVIQMHSELIAYVSKPEVRGSVAYFALNMPVDDGVVQENLGGVNSDMSKRNQVSYAEAFVRRMRSETGGYGFDDAKMYLSIFYGWDNAYAVPSYASAGADGYFINNYSYPKGGALPDADADGETLINADRLRISMRTFIGQYGDAPLVVESGFHTMQYNGGRPTSQTAGLVRDMAAKAKAMKAAVTFYKDNYPNVRGMLYFGYNLFKEEGSPPDIMDWALVYPARGEMRAADAITVGKAAAGEDASSAFGGSVVMNASGDGMSFQDCPPVQLIRLRYKAAAPVTVGIYSMDKLRKTVALPVAAAYTDVGIPVTIVEGYDMEIRLEEGTGLAVDAVEVCELLEAEHAALFGAAKTTDAPEASRNAAVADAVSRENRIAFAGTRGGERITIRYTSPSGCVLWLESGGEKYSLRLPATEGFSEVTAAIDIAAGADIALYGEGGSLLLDAFWLAGAPAPAKAAAADETTTETVMSAQPQPPAAPSDTNPPVGTGTKETTKPVAGAALLIGFGIVAALIPVITFLAIKRVKPEQGQG